MSGVQSTTTTSPSKSLSISAAMKSAARSGVSWPVADRHIAMPLGGGASTAWCSQLGSPGRATSAIFTSLFRSSRISLSSASAVRLDRPFKR